MDKIVAYKVPSVIRWIDTMPTSENGKLDRKATIQWYERSA
jgi:acyl-CoA synthetase (AMP-forming)/AMP-acid ligase II